MDDEGDGGSVENRPSCAESLTFFFGRDFREWRGLGACSPDELRRFQAPPVPGYALGRLGDRRARYFNIQMPGYDDPVSVWYRGGRVVLLEVRFPQLEPGLPSLEAALGPPQARLDFQWRSLRLEQGLLIYPQRGLALFVNPDNQIVLMLTAFAPTTLSNYQEELSLGLGEKKLGDGTIGFSPF